MSHITAEYDGNHLAAGQIELLHEGLVAELDEFAAEDAEPEPEPEP